MTKRIATIEPVVEIIEPITTIETVEQPVKTSKPKKEREQRACLCGCGELTYSRFKQGHDARLHSQLLKASRTGDEAATARLAARLAKLDEQIAAMQVKCAEIVAMQESTMLLDAPIEPLANW